MLTNFCIASLLLFTCYYGAASGVAVSQEPIAQDEDIARHYNSRYSIFDEPYNIEFKYHNYEQMSRFLRATSLRFQNLTALYSIGKSVKGTVSHYLLFILQFLSSCSIETRCSSSHRLNATETDSCFEQSAKSSYSI